MTTATLRNHPNSAWLATVVCCVGVVATGLSLENSILSFSIAAAFCIGLVFCGAALGGSPLTTAKLLFLNAGLLAAVVVLLRLILNNVGSRPPVFWPWFHRIVRVWWLSVVSAIILVLIGVGMLTIEVAGKLGGETTQKRFQRCVIASASILIVVNITNFLRPVWCADCFLPYGLPFTLFTEGGFAGGGGIVWLGLVADAALIPAFAAICTLLWNRIAAKLVKDP